MPASTQHLFQGQLDRETHSPTPQRSRSTINPVPKDLAVSGTKSLLYGFLAPACSTTEISAPMPAETGVLSPRRPRRVTTASTEPNSPFASPAPTRVSVNSPPPPSSLSMTNSSANSQQSSAVPSTSAVSAKVTLRAMGLALGDRVCVGPGGGASSEGAMSFSPAAVTSGRLGRLRYCGPVEFASGVWVGIELDEAFGKNNGSVNGVSSLLKFW